MRHGEDERRSEGLEAGKKKVVNFITASRTDGKEFNQRNYTKIR